MNKLTTEQQAIVNHIKTIDGLTLASSVAGSGKTSTLLAIALDIPHTNGLLMCYNKAIATEASRKFPKTTNCVTTHSLAYRAVVPSNKLKLGTFSYRDIREKLPFDDKIAIVNTLREFCLSRFTSFSDFSKRSSERKAILSLVPKYLDLMEQGKIECTHDFYLKLFHLKLANGELEYNPFDFIMLDEAGDLNEVTLEIFRLLPSKKKIAVGDAFQNIYTFNHTINCFDVLKDEGTIFYMTQSFRVADFIAKKIEHFCKSYLDPNMKFKGVKLSDTVIKSSAYITRTNSALIGKMIELNQHHQQYGLVRKASEIFRIPLVFCNIKYQGFISEPSYKHIQHDIDEWHENAGLRDTYKTVFSYLLDLYSEDFILVQTIKLVTRYGKSAILQAYSEAKKHESANPSLILATAHSCKGLEFDEVELANDLNESIADLILQLQTGRDRSTLLPNERESLNLYYTACSRAKKALHNDTHL